MFQYRMARLEAIQSGFLLPRALVNAQKPCEPRVIREDPDELKGEREQWQNDRQRLKNVKMYKGFLLKWTEFAPRISIANL